MGMKRFIGGGPGRPSVVDGRVLQGARFTEVRSQREHLFLILRLSVRGGAIELGFFSQRGVRGVPDNDATNLPSYPLCGIRGGCVRWYQGSLLWHQSAERVEPVQNQSPVLRRVGSDLQEPLVELNLVNGLIAFANGNTCFPGFAAGWGPRHTKVRPPLRMVIPRRSEAHRFSEPNDPSRLPSGWKRRSVGRNGRPSRSVSATMRMRPSRPKLQCRGD